MRISKLFGLPAHPLFVHVPVVLLPLVGIGIIAMAVSARARDRYGWAVLTLAIVAGLSTQLATESGQALRDSVAHTDALRHHVAIADSIRPLALLLFLAGLAIMLFDRRNNGRWPFRPDDTKRPGRPGVRVLLASAGVVLALVTNARLFQIGDSGARATWERVRLVDRKGGG
jgi:hypothetical protein